MARIRPFQMVAVADLLRQGVVLEKERRDRPPGLAREGDQPMIKVLTIRDPKSGALIIEEQIQPDEARDAALARIYRKILGPEAPEFMVTTKSIWLDDRDWAAELGRDWGDFGLALLGPKGDSGLEKARLVLWRVSETEQASKMKLPMWKENIDKVKNGELLDIIIPVKPKKPPAVGDRVTFLEAKPDPYGESILVSDGDSVSVYLTQVTNRGPKWFGLDIYSIAWDPPDPPRAKTRSKRSATRDRPAHTPRRNIDLG